MTPKNLLVILSVLALASSHVKAQALIESTIDENIVCDNDKPDHCSIPLDAGEQAPFKGMLLTHELALSMSLKLDFRTKELEAQLREAKTLLSIDLQTEKNLRMMDNKACTSREERLKREIKSLEPSFFEQPEVVAITTIILTLATVYTISKIK